MQPTTHSLVGLRHADGVQFLAECSCGDIGEPTVEHDGTWTLTTQGDVVEAAPSINFLDHFHTTNPVTTRWLN